MNNETNNSTDQDENPIVIVHISAEITPSELAGQEDKVAWHFDNALDAHLEAVIAGKSATDLTTPNGVTSHMEAATSAEDWNKRCDDVKKANGGYPSFWFAVIMLSGVAAKTQANW